MRGHVLTRDSAIWLITIFGSLVAYLIGAQIPPTQWSYMDWLQFAAAAVATLSGVLKTSPLPGETDAKVRAIRDGR